MGGKIVDTTLIIILGSGFTAIGILVFFIIRQNKKKALAAYKLPEGQYELKKTEVDETKYIIVEPYKTFKIHDLANMFPFNITPAMIESKIQHIIAAKQRFWNSLTPQWIIMGILVLIGGTLAAVIAWKFLGGGSPEVYVKLDPGLQQIASVSSNLTG